MDRLARGPKVSVALGTLKGNGLIMEKKGNHCVAAAGKRQMYCQTNLNCPVASWSVARCRLKSAFRAERRLQPAAYPLIGHRHFANGPVRRFTAAATALLIVWLTGCQHPGPRFNPRPTTATRPSQSGPMTTRINPHWLKAPSNIFTLGPGENSQLELLTDPTRKST